MAKTTPTTGISLTQWADHFPELDQQIERFVSDKTLIGTVAFLIGVNLWFALVILYLSVEWFSAML